MGLNYRVAFNVMGGLSIIFSIAFLLPAIVSLIYHEYANTLIFAGTAAAVLIIGLLLRFVTRNPKGELRIREGLFVVSFTWIMLSIVGAAPFMLSGDIPNFFDAVFETASGLTTTGATVVSDIESLSRGILFWRSFTHWMGGMGVLFLTIALIPMLYEGKQNIALESTGPTLDRTSSKLSDTAKSLYTIYIGLTVLQVILLKIGGMSLYDSMLHTFGSVGTGGFSDYADSVGHFHSLYIEIVIIVFMFMCGVSFNLYFLAMKRGPLVIFKNAEFRLYTIIIVVTTIIIAWNLSNEGNYNSFGHSLRDSLFQVVSIITTTGYATCDYEQWPSLAQALLFLLFFCGGCASSTAGGIKVYRVLVLYRLVKRSIGIRLHPRAVINVSVEHKKLANDVVISVTGFFLLYFVVLMGGTLLVSVDNYDFTTNFTAVASCLGNIGPGFALVGPVDSYGIFSGWSKLILTIVMIAGRLELFTFLAFFTPIYWDPDRY